MSTNDKQALFVTVDDGSEFGRKYRLTDWVDQKHAHAAFHAVQRFQWTGREVRDEIYVSSQVASLNKGRLAIKHFEVRSLDDPNYRSIPRIPSGEVVVYRWSEKTYVDDVAAVKAWNRANFKRYVGKEGGWIYRTDHQGNATGEPITQGWASLGHQAKVEVKYDGHRKVRYLVERASVVFTRDRLGLDDTTACTGCGEQVNVRHAAEGLPGCPNSGTTYSTSHHIPRDVLDEVERKAVLRLAGTGR